MSPGYKIPIVGTAELSSLHSEIAKERRLHYISPEASAAMRLVLDFCFLDAPWIQYFSFCYSMENGTVSSVCGPVYALAISVPRKVLDDDLLVASVSLYRELLSKSVRGVAV
jgi:hypothetical protein